jgi:serine/threonine-protein kinase
VCPKDEEELNPIGDDKLLGSSIGPYQVAALIGTGGMGRVYRGVHPAIGSRVAIKVLSSEFVDRPDLVQRFFDEARAVNVIRHENIVNVLDLDYLEDGPPYIVMEHLEGVPLSQLIQTHGVIPLRALAQIGCDMLAALDAAHSADVIHRDLKPDNIFVSPEGRATVLDFGIAKLLGGDSDAKFTTKAGTVVGTPHYVSPEMAQAHPVDARSDVYSAGLIIYEAAAGRRAFESNSLFHLLRMHINSKAEPPTSIRKDMSDAYEDVIMKALAKDPNERWQTAKFMRRALRDVMDGMPREATLAISKRRRMSQKFPKFDATLVDKTPPTMSERGGDVSVDVDLDLDEDDAKKRERELRRKVNRQRQTAPVKSLVDFKPGLQLRTWQLIVLVLLGATVGAVVAATVLSKL